MTRLERLAKEFAGDLTDLLNQTITHGVRIAAATARPKLCVLGRGITPQNLKSQVIDVTLGRKTASAYLLVDLTTEMDRVEDFLAVKQSRIGVYSDSEGRVALCHYDFETKPLNVYPKAHVQVSGTSPALDQLRTKRPDMEAHKLGELHFPVGGRRFRPTLEDVIEMLIVEGIADARPDWESVIAEHRKRWREIQLRAAVRRWPEWAAAALTDLGCQVEGLPQLLAKQRAESAN